MSTEIKYPWFFFYRIARLSFLVFLPTVFIMLYFYRTTYKEGLISQMAYQVEENLRTTQETLHKVGQEWQQWCQNLHPQKASYSLISKEGRILCDTDGTQSGSMTQNMEALQKTLARTFYSYEGYSEHFGMPALFASLKLSDDVILKKIVPITSLKDDMNRFDRVLFQKIVPFAFLSWVLFLILFYQATRPLGSILNKVEQFKADIPFNKNLQLLYKKDEWAHIQEALNEADSQLKNQVIKVKNENEKIAAILESIYDNIIAIDNYETILFYNSNFQRNFIKEKANELVPKIWHKFSNEKVLEAFRSVLSSGNSVSLKGLKSLSYLKPEHYYDLTVTPLRNSEGQIKGALGVLYDVTEFKLTEQMRVDFVANVSHEIRTPLTSIKGYTQILEAQKAKIDPDLHMFLEKIITNTERMIQLFNDLLNLSVIESKNIMKFEELPVKPLIESASETIQTNYPQKNIAITTDFQLATIRGDQRLMDQVILNLLDNACKYAGDQIDIKISTFRKDNNSYLVVTDNGPGISREHLQRIFERFYRVDSSREASRGTGLGLSIVKHIIAKHGGRIWAESEETRGSTFIIELPLRA